MIYKNKIKEIRLALDKTRMEFADMIGVSRTMVSHYEAQRYQPSAEVLMRICAQTGKPLTEIVYFRKDI